jgi:hypothetical protein
LRKMTTEWLKNSIRVSEARHQVEAVEKDTTTATAAAAATKTAGKKTSIARTSTFFMPASFFGEYLIYIDGLIFANLFV